MLLLASAAQAGSRWEQLVKHTIPKSTSVTILLGQV